VWTLLWTSTAGYCIRVCGAGVPDVSANAGVGMVFYANGAWSVGLGTSFAAPFISGLVADADSGCGRVGVMTPLLYGLYSEGSYGSAFADVTSGNTDMTGSNSGPFPAAANYDAATGIGSPYAAGLTCASVSSVSAGYSGSTVTVSGLGLEACRHRFRINPCDCAVRNRNIGRCHRACRRRHRHRLGFEHRRR
jgi:subtilase family serine protease